MQSQSTTMDSTNRSPPTIRSSRRGSASTVDSEKYLPMPIGRWTLNLHGKCPRCHHHHTAVTVQVKVSKDSTQDTHVHCEECDQKWLVFSGRNLTQISLLSTKTKEPDPVEQEFRYTLIHMVKSATAIASPASPTIALADIPESSRTPSRDRSLRSPNHDTPQPIPRPPITTTPVQLNPSLAPRINPLARTPKRSSFGNPGANIQNVLMELKEKIKAKFPIIRRLRLRPTKKQIIPRTPSKGKEKQIQGENLSEHRSASKEQTIPQNLPPHNDVKEVPTTGVVTVDAGPSYRSASDAIDSLKKLNKDIIRDMSHEERVKWIREQISAFKARRFPRGSTKVNSEPEPYIPMVNNSTQIYHAELQPFPFLSARPQRRHSLELAGVGTHLTLSDIYNSSTPTLHNRPLSISVSDTCVSQMSQADTAVEDMVPPTSPRTFYLLQHERHRSPSPRPRSSYSAQLRQILQSRADPRSSIDSAGTGGANRNISTAGRRTSRFSLASMAPTLFQAPTEPSASQTQIPPPLPTAAESSGARERASSNSTPNLNEHPAPSEENRRSTE